MLKTTSTPVKTAIRRYILDHIDGENYKIANFPNSESAILWCRDIFRNEKSYEISRYGERAAFESWIRGLASALSLPFLYAESAHDLLVGWLGQTESEADRFDEYDATERLIKLVVREFFAMVNDINKGKKVL